MPAWTTCCCSAIRATGGWASRSGPRFPDGRATARRSTPSAQSVHADAAGALAERLHAQSPCMAFMLVDVPQDRLMAFPHTKRSNFISRRRGLRRDVRLDAQPAVAQRHAARFPRARARRPRGGWRRSSACAGPAWDLAIALHDLSIDEKESCARGYGLDTRALRALAGAMRAFNLLNYPPKVAELAGRRDRDALAALRMRLAGAFDLYALEVR